MSRKKRQPIQVNVHVEQLDVHIFGQQEKTQDNNDNRQSISRSVLHFISALLLASVPALLTAFLK